MSNIFQIVIPMIVVLTGILLQKHIPSFLKGILKTHQSEKVDTAIFTTESLAKYNGIIEKKLYMAVMGIVYDVSSGPQHYARGSPYHYFVGKDGSRALVTGDFEDESENKDYILDLSCADFLNLLQWRDTIGKKYNPVGILAGRYYDTGGWSTAFTLEVDKRTEECLREREFDRKQDLKYPPCNMAWTEQEGTKVWCTKSSGGVSRGWVGVPRQLFTPGEKIPKCVCMNTDEEPDISRFKEYKNCANNSVVCFVEAN